MTDATARHDEGGYLWDPATAVPDEAVSRVERALSGLRYEPAAAPLDLPDEALAVAVPAPAGGRARRAALALLAAAALLIVSMAGLGAWRWSWPEGRAWPVRLTPAPEAPSAGAAGALEVGAPLATGPAETVRVAIARIGSMVVRPGARVELRATASNAHRLALSRGTIDVGVWAPPGAVVVQTPAGTVVDMGCVFTLDVDDDGVSRVSVTSGWVQLVNFHGEMLVPAGASSEMRPDAAPLVPVFDDAAPAFRDAARALEAEARAGGMAAGEGTHVVDPTLLAAARPRDVLTLLALARALPLARARPLVERAAALAPPPAGVSVDAVASGDRDASWVWQDALGLPPPKQWWRNWRDAF